MVVVTPPNFDSIPDRLRGRPQWVAWKFVSKPGQPKPSKIPFTPSTGRRASSVAPSTWGTFDEAVCAYQLGGYQGIGFVFSEDDPFCGIDLDHVRDATTGTLCPEAEELLNELDSYTEVSPSGTGVHVIVEGQLSDGAKHKIAFPWGEVEMYDQRRYFTVTGLLLGGSHA